LQHLELTPGERCPHPLVAPQSDRSRPPDESPDAGEQLVWSERLHEVVVCADEQAGDAVERLRPPAGDKEDRESVSELVPQLPTNLITGDPRQAHLEDYERRMPVACCLERLLSGASLANSESCSTEESGRLRTTKMVVVDDENWAAGSGCSRHRAH